MPASNSERVFRRLIRLERRSPQRVAAALADDAHHFTLRLDHDGDRITAIAGHARRYPWTVCPGASERLGDLVGMSLSPESTSVGRHTRARENCTHLFDLAGLAVAFAHGKSPHRTYAGQIWDRPDGAEEATLARDDMPVLHWRYRAGRIETPEPFVDVPLFTGGFLAWAEANLGEQAEAAIVLRRAAMIARIRHAPFDPHARPTDTQPIRGQCFAFHPGIAENATRQPATRLDFSNDPGALRHEIERTLEEDTP